MKKLKIKTIVNSDKDYEIEAFKLNKNNSNTHIDNQLNYCFCFLRMCIKKEMYNELGKREIKLVASWGGSLCSNVINPMLN